MSAKKPDNASAALPKTAAPVMIRRLVQEPLDLHYHEFDELVVTLKGKGVHFTETEEYEIHAGDVFFIRPGASHGYRDTEGLEIANVLYYPDKLGLPLAWIRESPGYKALFDLEPESRRKFAFKGRLSLSLEALPAIERMIQEIESEVEESQDGARFFMAAATLMRLIGTLSRLYEKGPSPSAAQLVRIGKTLAFIETAYHRRITLDELAKMAKMSKSSLIREFKRLTGRTPVDYLLSIRLAKAAELLTAGDATIGEAALRCGFTDGNYFARQFKRATGLPPREYRRLMEKGQAIGQGKAPRQP